MTLMRRAIGIVIILVGLGGLVGALYSLFTLRQAADDLNQVVAEGVDYGIEALTVISKTLTIADQTVEDTAAVLDNVVKSSQSTAQALESIRPAIQELNSVVSMDLPASLEAIRNAMPGVEQASHIIDSTLRKLASFQWSTIIPIVNHELSFGLGIDYDPPVPLDVSVAQVNAALAGMPDQLEGVQADLQATNQSLGDTAIDVRQAGESAEAISRDLHATSQALEESSDLVGRAIDQLEEAREEANHKIHSGYRLLSGVLIWLALSQIAPLYLGCTLLGPQIQPKQNTLR